MMSQTESDQFDNATRDYVGRCDELRQALAERQQLRDRLAASEDKVTEFTKLVNAAREAVAQLAPAPGASAPKPAPATTSPAPVK